MSQVNAHKPGYKHTPLGWIPEDWEIKEFGKIVLKAQYGLSASTEVAGLHQIVGMKNIQDGRLVLDNCARINLSELEYKKYKLETNDFLFNRTNSYELVGKSVLVEQDVEATFASYLVRFKLDTSLVYPKYIFYYFNTKISDNRLKAIATKAVSQANINPTILQSTFELLVPSIKEQKKIAITLNTWDEAIAQTQQLIAKLQERNKGLMQELLTGKKRLPGFEKDWSHLRIEDIAQEISLKNKKNKELTVLSCTKYDGLVPSLEYFGRRVFGSDTSTYKLVPINTFAYATNHIEEGSIGYQDFLTEALISPMYTVFRTNDLVYDYYLYQLLKSHHYIHHYKKRMEGSIDRRGGLRWDDFSKIPLALPEYEEQVAIANFVAEASKEVTFQKQHLAKLQTQKKGLMQKLLTGEVRVKID